MRRPSTLLQRCLAADEHPSQNLTIGSLCSLHAPQKPLRIDADERSGWKPHPPCRPGRLLCLGRAAARPVLTRKTPSPSAEGLLAASYEARVLGVRGGMSARL